MRPISPTLGRKLNLASPLAKGLRDAVMVHGAYGRNYANPLVRPVFTGTPDVGQSWAGPGMYGTGGTKYATVTPDYTFNGATEYSFSFLYHAVTIPGAYTAMIEFGSNTGSDTGRMFSLFIDTSGNISYLIIGGAYIGTGIGFALGVTAGKTNRYTFTKTSNVVAIYRDGTRLGTVTDFSYFNTPTPAWYLGYNVTGGGQHSNAIFNDLLVWHNRCLTPDDVRLLASDNEAVYAKPPTLRRGLSTGGAAALSAEITGTVGVTGSLTALHGRLAEIAGTVDVTGAFTAGPAGRGHQFRRWHGGRHWQDVPMELQPVVSLAENYADTPEVVATVDQALTRYLAMQATASLNRQMRLLDEARRAIVHAVEEAAERDDEEALRFLN